MDEGKFNHIRILRERAKRLRKSPTEAEQAFWQIVGRRRFHRHRFRRQVVMAPYIVDFYCRDLKLAIEIDGGGHRHRRASDIQRDSVLAKRGISVLRFTNEEVLENPGKVWKIMDCWRRGATESD